MKVRRVVKAAASGMAAPEAIVSACLAGGSDIRYPDCTAAVFGLMVLPCLPKKLADFLLHTFSPHASGDLVGFQQVTPRQIRIAFQRNLA